MTVPISFRDRLPFLQTCDGSFMMSPAENGALTGRWTRRTVSRYDAGIIEHGDAIMIVHVRVTILVDNKSIIGADFAPGGFSSVIECRYAEGNVLRLLFDTGPDAAALRRSTERLGIDLSDISYIVLSHGHFDHTGGLEYALEHSNDHVRVICHPDALIEKVLPLGNGTERSVGITITDSLRRAVAQGRVPAEESSYTLAPGVTTTGTISRETEFERLNPSLLNVLKVDETGRVRDPIIEDMALVIDLAGEGKLVFTGCCHAGIVNTIDHIERMSDDRIVSIIGGLQLYQAGEEVLERTAARLRRLPLTSFYPMHSSGDVGIGFFKSHLGDVVKDGGAGTVIEFRARDRP